MKFILCVSLSGDWGAFEDTEAIKSAFYQPIGITDIENVQNKFPEAHITEIITETVPWMDVSNPITIEVPYELAKESGRFENNHKCNVKCNLTTLKHFITKEFAHKKNGCNQYLIATYLNEKKFLEAWEAAYFAEVI